MKPGGFELVRSLRNVLVQSLGQNEGQSSEDEAVDDQAGEERGVVQRLPQTGGHTSQLHTDGDTDDEEASHHDRREAGWCHLADQRQSGGTDEALRCGQEEVGADQPPGGDLEGCPVVAGARLDCEVHDQHGAGGEHQPDAELDRCRRCSLLPSQVGHQQLEQRDERDDEEGVDALEELGREDLDLSVASRLLRDLARDLEVLGIAADLLLELEGFHGPGDGRVVDLAVGVVPSPVGQSCAVQPVEGEEWHGHDQHDEQGTERPLLVLLGANPEHHVEHDDGNAGQQEGPGQTEQNVAEDAEQDHGRKNPLAHVAETDLVRVAWRLLLLLDQLIDRRQALVDENDEKGSDRHPDAGASERKAPTEVVAQVRGDEVAEQTGDVDAHVEDLVARVNDLAAVLVELAEHGADVGLE